MSTLWIVVVIVIAIVTIVLIVDAVLFFLVRDQKTITNWIALTLLGVNVFSALLTVSVLVYLLAVSSSLEVVNQVMVASGATVTTTKSTTNLRASQASRPVEFTCSPKDPKDVNGRTFTLVMNP